jgi:hypothetical protein
MKTLTKTIVTNQDIENRLKSGSKEIFEFAENEGLSHGGQIPALPRSTGDTLPPYLTFKSKCESLALEILQVVQPASQLSEGKMDKDVADAQQERFQKQIDKIETDIKVLERGLPSSSDFQSIRNRIIIIHAINVFLLIGEAILNLRAFEVIGEVWISCLLLSATVAFAIGFGSHVAGRKYQEAKTKMGKLIVVVLSIIGIVSVSYVISALRTQYFRNEGIEIDPIWIIIFNLAFFAISFLANIMIYPTADEVELYTEFRTKQKNLNKLKRSQFWKLRNLKRHQEKNAENLKSYVRSISSAEYYLQRIETIFRQAVAIYINANRLVRKDACDCYTQPLPALEIPVISFKSILTKYNYHENTSNNNS